MADAAGVIASAPQRNVERLFEFMLLGMTASGYLAVASSGYLDAPTIALMAAAIVIRALLVLDVVHIQFSSALVTAATLAYIGFYPIDYLFLSKEFLPATVHLVFFLAFTKILTATTDRDYSYVKVIAFLELLAASLLTAGMSFFVFLALFLVFAVGTFASAEVRRATQRPIRIVRSGFKRIPLRLSVVAVFITGGILSITGGLFFVLPRTARAAFQHLVSPRYHLPGFSSQITLGQIGAIKNDSTPVMHVRFLFTSANAPRPETLKWRGMALNEFDGQRWTKGSVTPDETISVEGSGMTRLLDDESRPHDAPRMSYEVHLTDIDTDVLFLAGVPEAVNVRAPLIKRSEAGTYRVPFGGSAGLTYIAQSYFNTGGRAWPAPPPHLTGALRDRYLELPPLDPRIPELARTWSAGTQNQFGQALEIERRLKRNYGYTLELLPSLVHDPLANFLFDRKKGHCEYFASAMAVMLRTLGIPSRIVTGFQSGIYNPISGRQLIRTSDAHSWVEAYLPRRGWITFDPTPPEPEARSASLWTKLALYLDAADTFWQDWVLNYDLDRQMTLATQVQNSSRSNGWMDRAVAAVTQWRLAATNFLRHYGAPLAAALIFIALVILYGPALRKAWAMRRRLRRVQRGLVENSDATLLYCRMLRNLERRGFAKPAWVTASEFVRLIPESDLTPIVDDLTSLYHDLRFGGNRDAGPRMMALLAQLERM